MKKAVPYTAHGISQSWVQVQREIMWWQRKGLTLREIADRCRYPLGIVHAAATRLLK